MSNARHLTPVLGLGVGLVLGLYSTIGRLLGDAEHQAIVA
jgi:hypothetical protein